MSYPGIRKEIMRKRSKTRIAANFEQASPEQQRIRTALVVQEVRILREKAT
jgi:hypothetical protein